jgi:hypothetical protein
LRQMQLLLLISTFQTLQLAAARQQLLGVTGAASNAAA